MVIEYLETRRRLSFATSALLCVTLLGCSTPGDDVRFRETINVSSGEDRGASRPSREIEIAGRRPQQTNAPRAQYIDGTGQFAQQLPQVPAVRSLGDDEVSLTFKNTDIRIVIRAVLGDTLGETYVVDPRVSGNVTLETSGSISKDALRMTLEAVLKTKGFALVQSTQGYLILPLEEAPRSVGQIRQGLPASVNLPGFAVQVVPLKNTLPSEMKDLIEPFAPQRGILRSDDARQLMVLAGTAQELAAMMRAIETFDVDRMAGMSFAVFTLRYVEADQIVKELESIFASGAQEGGTPIQFIAVPRINRIIAVGPNKLQLRSVESWVTRLDLGDSAPGRRIYVYQVSNGRAADMADTLNLILGSRYAGRGVGQRGVQRPRGSAGGIAQNRNTNLGGGVNQGIGGANRGGGFMEDEIRIVPNEESNSIVIMATPSEFAVVESALKQIDLPPRQVLVEVTIAEVTLTDELRYGLQWSFDFNNNQVAFGQSPTPSQQFPGFSWANTSTASAQAVLNAIESMTDVKVISSPKILVLNNESATIQVGDEVPVPTQSAVSTNDSNAPIVNSIQYRNTGVILNVTPRINEGGLVMLDVEQEQSNVVETASSGIDAPTVQQRRMTSSIAVQNGSTIALGGLISSTASINRSGVPILKDIPLLGNAFRSNDLVERRNELIVLLTPRIIRNNQETQEVMDYLSREFRNVLGPGQAAAND